MSDANETAGWRSDVDEIDAVLLDGLQSGFPVRPRPFDAVAETVGRIVGSSAPNDEPRSLDAATVVEHVRDLDRRGLIRRLGPVLDPSAIGSSTLAALRVPDDVLGPVVDVVNEYPQVTHNYRRDHEWNVWFVVTAESRARRDAILDEIADRTGYDPLNLPKRKEYALDLQFPVIGDRADDRFSFAVDRGVASLDPERNAPSTTAHDVDRFPDEAIRSTFDRRLLETIQNGLPITTTPYADVAADLGVDDADGVAGADADGVDRADADGVDRADVVVDAIDSLSAAGFIKRIGLIVDHRAVGFRHNCMVAWDVPSGVIDEAGARASEFPHVTKCYHRPARPERDWPFSLFTMIHGRDPDRVDEWIAELAAERLPYPFVRLDTVERFKQTGARYETLLARDDE